MNPAPSKIAPTPGGPPTRSPSIESAHPRVHAETTLMRPQPNGSEPLKLGLSKKWVLPPRPKPGRKPNREKGVKPKGAQNDASHPVASKPIPVGQDTKSPSIPAPLSAPSPEKDDCGACSHDGESCVCQDLKEAARPLVDPLFTDVTPVFPAIKSDNYEVDIAQHMEQFKPIAAIPLKRDTNTKISVTKPKKFRRLDDVMHISVISEPSSEFKVDLSPGESCGFCRDNTPCLCAGEGLGDAGQSFNNHEHLLKPKSLNTTEKRCEKPLANPVKPGREAEKSTTDYGCPSCQQEPMSMLFCLSLSSARPLSADAVSISCSAAFKILEKHPKFKLCDLGALVQKLESRNRMVGVQSITKALQYLNSI